MTVPSATPTRLSAEERAAVDAAVRRVLADGPWIGGQEVDAFEVEFGAAVGVTDVVGCANGTDALVLALTALDLPPGSRILVPGHDGGYGATAARLAGHLPVPVDVDPATGDPSLATVQAAGDGLALIVAHLHGDLVDLSAIDDWRRSRGMALIEDCAQAAGASGAGAVGDAAAFSFYPTKNLAAAGDAGAVAFRDPAAALRARRLAQYGWGERYRIEVPGGRNSRLDPLQAAVLRARLPFLDDRNARRRAVRARYADAAADLAFLGSEHGVAHHAVVRDPRRDQLATHLQQGGVSTAIHYPFAVADMPGLALDADATPGARRLASEVLSVPCTPELTDDEVDTVVAGLQSWTR